MLLLADGDDLAWDTGPREKRSNGVQRNLEKIAVKRCSAEFHDFTSLLFRFRIVAFVYFSNSYSSAFLESISSVFVQRLLVLPMVSSINVTEEVSLFIFSWHCLYFSLDEIFTII